MTEDRAFIWGGQVIEIFIGHSAGHVLEESETLTAAHWGPCVYFRNDVGEWGVGEGLTESGYNQHSYLGEELYYVAEC